MVYQQKFLMVCATALMAMLPVVASAQTDKSDIKKEAQKTADELLALPAGTAPALDPKLEVTDIPVVENTLFKYHRHVEGAVRPVHVGGPDEVGPRRDRGQRRDLEGVLELRVLEVGRDRRAPRRVPGRTNRGYASKNPPCSSQSIPAPS